MSEYLFLCIFELFELDSLDILYRLAFCGVGFASSPIHSVNFDTAYRFASVWG